jgi:hypothetical protein
VLTCVSLSDIIIRQTTMVGGLVNKAKLTAPLTCPLCSNIFREPTTIPECLHTCKSFLFSSSFSPLLNYAYDMFVYCLVVWF